MSSFQFIIKLQWTIEEISIFNNSSHLEWRAELSDTILKWDYPRTIPAKFGLIWFSGFTEEDLNVIFYQNMPNLHNRYKSVEREISQKSPEYRLNYSLPCSCSGSARYGHCLVSILNSSNIHIFWKPVLTNKVRNYYARYT